MTTIGFLHTSPAHVATFRDLVRELAPGAEDIHVVEEDLLARARQGEPVTIDLTPFDGADVLVCTCSTIGPVAEARDERVIRVDRAMARQAARYDRIGVVVALESTIEPTLAILWEEAVRGAKQIRVELSERAWAYFENGDLAAYYGAIADTARGLADCEVIVLAQASMAPAASLIPTRTLSSPRPAVEYAVRKAQQRNPGEQRHGI